MGSSRFESKSSNSTQRGLHPPLPVQTQFNQITNYHKQLCQATKTVPPFGGTVSAGKQKCCRTGSKPKLTGVLQPAIFGTQTQQPVETYPGPEHLEHLPKHRVVQNETPETIRTSLQIGEWVTSIDFNDAYFHIPIHSQSRKYMRFYIQGRSYQFKALPFGLSTAPMEFTVVAKEVKLVALQRGIRIHQYLDNWLVRATSPPNLSPAYTDLGSSLSRTRLVGKQGEVRTGSKTGFQLHRLPVRLERGQGQTHIRALADLDRQNSDNSVRPCVSGPAVHVPHRASNSHRKTSPPRSTSYETHPVALEGTRITRKGDTCSQIAPPPPKVVAGGKQCASRSTITPTKTCSADIYRCIKRRVGCSLKRAHYKGNLVTSRKQVAYKPLGTISTRKWG